MHQIFCTTFTQTHSLFIKMGLTRPLFCLFSFFSQCKDFENVTINDKSVDGVLGTRTRGPAWYLALESADESTELWWHPQRILLLYLSHTDHVFNHSFSHAKPLSHYQAFFLSLFRLVDVHSLVQRIVGNGFSARIFRPLAENAPRQG